MPSGEVQAAPPYAEMSGVTRQKPTESFRGTAVSISAGSFEILFRVDEKGRLIQKGLSDLGCADSKEGAGYPTAGDGWVFEPALNLVHSDGNTSTDLRVEEMKKSERSLEIVLVDSHYPVRVRLVFQAFPEHQVIEARSEISHSEPGPLRIEAAASSSLDLGRGARRLTQFCGNWADEANMVQEDLKPGIKVLDSKLGVRAHQFRAPWFLVSDGPLCENEGRVLAGSLSWSGSFRFAFEGLPLGSFRVTAGINPSGSAYYLEPGDCFETPTMVWAFSDSGAGDLTRRLHRFVRSEILREGERPRAVLLNNWEATYFKFDEGKVVSLFDGARDLGMELFLLDDGWFGTTHPRNDDTQGLGDWEPIPEKLPHGISALADAAGAKGLRFGLWFEPEMVNPRSQLFERHPDWVISQPHRELELQRNQLALDLSNPEVREHVFDVVDRNLAQNPGISYVKWDCNRYLTQPGSHWLAPNRQSHLQIDYVRGLYEIMGKLAVKHPNVEIMMCSGGGGRVDYRALSFAHEVWPSDMTDPVRRIFIQWGFSYFVPAIATANHVTRWGGRPIKFCFDVAMSGRLGMDVDVDELSPEDREFAKSAVADYKQIRDVVQLGDLYRLESPYEGPRAALAYRLGDRCVAFVFSSDGCPEGRLPIPAVSDGSSWSIREISVGGDRVDLGTVSGADVASTGLHLDAMAPFGSRVFELTLQ